MRKLDEVLSARREFYEAVAIGMDSRQYGEPNLDALVARLAGISREAVELLDIVEAAAAYRRASVNLTMVKVEATGHEGAAKITAANEEVRAAARTFDDLIDRYRS